MDAEDTTTTTTPAPVEGGPVVEPTTLAPNPPAAVQGVGVEAEPVAPSASAPANPTKVESGKDRVKELEAQIAALKGGGEAAAAAAARVDALEARLTEQRQHLFGLSLDQMRVKPSMREYAKLALGDIDPSTAGGREKLERWISDHPDVIDNGSTVDRTAAIATSIKESVGKHQGIGAKVMNIGDIEARLRNQRKGWGA